MMRKYLNLRRMGSILTNLNSLLSMAATLLR